ncbi:MAG: DUF4352 domain-containing protein [Arachnia sp.]
MAQRRTWRYALAVLIAGGAAVGALGCAPSPTTHTPGPEVSATGTTSAAPVSLSQPETTASQPPSPGSSADPLPLGETASGGGWSVQVNSFTADATAEVVAANDFNQEPAEGEAYALVNLTLTNTGTDALTPLLVSVDYVAADGTVFTAAAAQAVAPEAVPAAALAEGDSATGNVVLRIPRTVDGMIRVTLDWETDPVCFTATASG